MLQPFRRTPRPNIWMISGPSPTPTCINPIVLTRHEFQPAMKRRAPMTTFTVESGRSTPPNRRAAKTQLAFDVEVGVVVLRQQPVERRGIAHVDDAERRAVRDPQVQLALARGQMDDVQAPLPVEQQLAQLGVEVGPHPRKLPEAPDEVVVPRVVQQPRPAFKEARQHRAHGIAVREDPAEERQDAGDVGTGLPIRPARPLHGPAQKHPQRLRRIERAPSRPVLPPDAALLIERQQAAQQVHVAVLVLRAVREVGDRVVLAVAVVVEPPVGVVEQQALAVGVQQIPILPAHHLLERGRVFEREATAGEFPATFAPDLARWRPSVPRRPAPDCHHQNPPRRHASLPFFRPACSGR